MVEKNCFDMTKLILQIMCVTVVQWSRSCLHVQIHRVRPPAMLFSVPFFFSCLAFFLNTIFPLAFFLYSYCWPCWSCTWINIDILSLSPELYFGKRISKALDLHTGQAYNQIKTISPVKTCPSSETTEFCFNVSWHRDRQHTVHHKLYYRETCIKRTPY